MAQISTWCSDGDVDDDVVTMPTMPSGGGVGTMPNGVANTGGTGAGASLPVLASRA